MKNNIFIILLSFFIVNCSDNNGKIPKHDLARIYSEELWCKNHREPAKCLEKLKQRIYEPIRPVQNKW